MKLNKLQIKAEVFTFLSFFQTEEDVNVKNIDRVVEYFSQFEDKKSVQEILLKEFLKAEDQKALVISILLFRLCEKDDLEKALWEILADKKIPDNAKLNSLNLLKDLGQVVDYQELGKYFSNPNEIVDLDTKKLLESAILNPEAQIDFLDFIKSLSKEDAKLLISSLGRDYSMDDLANILSPVFLHDPYSEIGLLALEILADTKSKIALSTLIEAQDFIENQDIANKIKKAISTLKIAGIRSSDLKDFYKEILSNSTPFQFYTNYPDGRGNQALIFSRMKANELIQMFAVVCNDKVGILDCFGFNEISADEFDRIVTSFYNKGSRIYINPNQIKYILTRAEKLSRKIHFKIPYEYLCWKTLIADVEEIPISFESFLEKYYDKHKLIDEEIECLYVIPQFQRWFFDTSYSEEYKTFIKNLDKEIVKQEFSIDLDKYIDKNLEKVYSIEEQHLLNNRILMTAFLSHINDEKPIAQILFALIYDEDAKEKFRKNILRKSIYEYYVGLKFKMSDEEKALTIFEKKSKKSDINFTLKQIEMIIAIIESTWVDDSL